MNKIRQILKEEVSDPFSSVPNEILFDMMNEFEGEFDEKTAEKLCKYLNISPEIENTYFFNSLIDLNDGVSRPEDIVRPTKKNFEVVYKIKEKLWVRYETLQTVSSYSVEGVEQQIYHGEINAFDGDEVYGSRDIYDSEYIDEDFEINED